MKYFKNLLIKSFGKGAEVSDEQMQKINTFALEPLTADDIYVRKFLLAHNGIDRDIERFPEDVLDDFAKTLPGKSFLFGHDRPNPGIGLFFDAYTESITPEQFRELTGEDIKLPDDIETAKVLWSWSYMMKISDNAGTMANIDGGIYRHVSIGFKAADIVAIKKDPNGPVQYWQYVGPAEALEGSLVWLGAQQGATAQKAILISGDELAALKANNLNKLKTTEQGGKDRMKEFLEKLSKMFGRFFTEENVIDELKTIVGEKDTKITNLEAQVSSSSDEKDKKITELNDKIKELTPLAVDGKAYREGLITQYTALKTKLEELPADNETKQNEAKKVAESFPVEFLKTEVEALQKRVEEKFPDESGVKGNDPNKERNDDGEEKKGKLVPNSE